jgi:hypothetical protein
MKKWLEDMPRPRITTPAEAWRCIHAIIDLLRRQESPLAAEDLEDSVMVLRQQAASLRVTK